MQRLKLLFCVIIVAFLTSCARAPIRPPVVHSIEPYTTSADGTLVGVSSGIIRSDVWHEVGPGETVWRISKMYDVSEDDVVMANSLRDRNKLEKGQKLLIPDAAPLRVVIPMPKSRKWKYIIVHHSATDVGNALRFDYVHSNNRRWKGLGYHFVIDNGTYGKKDGQIEISPRWLHKENGAHCKAGGMNYKGIGICLVGNFSEDKVSDGQMKSLIFLVKELKKHYRIPNSKILGHGQVKGASTECPGKKFPWRDFWRNLNQ